MISRRDFLQRGAGFAAFGLLRQDPAQSAAGGGADTLPMSFGNVAAVGAMDNDPVVVGTERRLRCRCGCTLDVYTCRTTDFSCTVSPAMHRDVVAQIRSGKSSEAVVQSFFDRYGATVLMAPPAHGLNLAAYLLPGVGVAAIAVAIVVWLRGREPAAVASPVAPPASNAADLERLRRALDDVDS